MCGIAGIITRGSGYLDDTDRGRLDRMLSALAHRGPDDRGCWSSSDGRILLGHTRLAILDLSPAGHEPITSRDGQVTATFNGEIFNHTELRATLPSAQPFRGHCDAETLVEVLARRGEAGVNELRGFFAFGAAMPEGSVLLVRDRMGEKPLFYAETGSRVLFASELRSLLASGLVDARVDPLSLALYTGVGSVPPPRSIIEGVRVLPAASLAVVTRDGVSEPRTWWRPPVPAEGAAPRPEEVVEQAEAHLRASVADRLLADVPVGAFLSGGIDSPLVVALMQEAMGRPVRTFTVGFEPSSGGVDERRASAAVARALGSEHSEHVITSEALPGTTGRFFDALDQPSGDAFNSFLASEAVRGEASAVLSGIGADELLYGYAFARRAAQLGSLTASLVRLPVGARSAVVGALGGPQRLGPLGRLRRGSIAVLAPDLVRTLLTRPERARLGLGSDAVETWLSTGSGGVDPGRQLDLRVFLQAVLLPDLDAMTMAHSLEARAPFLDHRFVEWSLALPPGACWSGRSGKAPLRTLAARHVPQVAGGPKRGFDLPLAGWMAGPLAPVVDELTAASARRGLTDGERLARLVGEVRMGRRHARSVWHLLVLEAWLARHVPDAGG